MMNYPGAGVHARPHRPGEAVGERGGGSGDHTGQPHGSLSAFAFDLTSFNFIISKDFLDSIPSPKNHRC